nr:SLC13 family permease [Desulfitibacter alkalitolerans]
MLPLAVMFIPTSDAFTDSIRLFLAITLAVILVVAFENLPLMVPSILLPLAYVLTKLAPSQAVYSPWSTFIPWMFMGGMILANVLQSIGLLKRVAYWCIIKTGGSYNGILYGLMVAGIVLNLLLPANMIIPLAALTYGLCIALNIGKSKEAAGIMLTGAMAALLPLFFIYNPNVAIIFGMGATVAPEATVSWGQYLFHNIPAVFWCFFMVFVTSKVFRPEKPIDAKDYITEEYKKLGKMTSAEKKGTFVCLALLAFLMTGSIHKIEIGWGFALAACLIYFPGIGVGTEQDIKTCNFPMVFFVTACMAIGQVANVLGVGKLISEAVLPIMIASGDTGSVILVWLLCVIANFLLTPLAIMASLTAPLTQVALDLGINPVVIYYTIFHGVDQIILPYEYVLYLIFFTFGLIRLTDFMKIFGIKMVLNLIFLLVILIPYWKLIGLL